MSYPTPRVPYEPRYDRSFRNLAGLTPAALATIFSLTARHKVPVCADPTSTALASRLCPYLRDLHLIAPLRYYVTQQPRLGDAHVYGGQSRFMTPAVRAQLEQVIGASMVIGSVMPLAFTARPAAAA